ncbi:helix-turn-helix domain-containing protein [Agathobaculum sp. NTUH-O15-33]|uniref:helix-turn-helix domain-containing protein n=1 Tax=Agathobaculum sp. NTUH-O15-33 TaxID=3079302 RepID=UPI002958411B|nr:helix-turn-helix domain-containing protein [Agathobaculum sp. NTUH-O15-33]WNX84601.1 helix-turn-helix domain-containing protein [Agathobaculum sp. NTUH-O15-33]
MEDTTGARIKKRRKELGFSVEELADDFKKGPATLYRYERYDVDQIPVEILELYSKKLNVSINYLLRLTDDPDKGNIDDENLKISKVRAEIKAFKRSNMFIGSPEEAHQQMVAQHMKRMRFNQRFNAYFEQLSDAEIDSVLNFMGYLVSLHKTESQE